MMDLSRHLPCKRPAPGGYAPVPVDSTGLAWMGAADSLPVLLARGVELLAAEESDERLARMTGDVDMTVIHAARCSGMAEVLAALQLYLIDSAKYPRKAVPV